MQQYVCFELGAVLRADSLIAEAVFVFLPWTHLCENAKPLEQVSKTNRITLKKAQKRAQLPSVTQTRD